MTDLRLLLSENPFSLTTRVYFELSNRCNLAAFHSNCPVGPKYQDEKNEAGGTLKYKDYLCQGSYLSIDAIERSLIELGNYNFSGVINFHRYNDPLVNIDLVRHLAQLTRKYCCEADILVYTNALQLNQEKVETLISDGVTKFTVSAYNETMLRKIELLKTWIESNQNSFIRPVDLIIGKFIAKDSDDKWGDSALDNRLSLYKRAEIGEVKVSPYGLCRAPLNELTISHTGEMVACCLDWKDTISFGNINRDRLSDICRSEKALKMYEELAKDIRSNPICRACGWSR